MANELERSLDELIGGNDSRPRSRSSRGPPRHPRGHRDRSRERHHGRSNDSYRDRYEAPRRSKIQKLSNGKAYVKVTNLHYEISEEDLKNLFEKVGETSFVSIEYTSSGRSTGVAYVGFRDLENNKSAVEQFNGKKAVGERITVEEIRPLNILATAPRGQPRGSTGRTGPRKDGPRRDARPKKPTLEDLDAELNSYMNKEEAQKKQDDSKGSRPGRKPKPTVEDLDAELDTYMSNQPFPSTGAE